MWLKTGFNKKKVQIIFKNTQSEFRASAEGASKETFY